MKNLSAQELETVRALAVKGLTVYDISQKLNIRKDYLIAHMKKHQIPNAQTLKRKTRTELITRMVEAGATYNDISEEMNVSLDQVMNLKSSLGIKLKIKKRLPPKRRSLVHQSWLERIQKGETIRTIAEEHGFTQSAISMALKRLSAEVTEKREYRPRIQIDDALLWKDRLEKGEKIRTIAEEYGVSVSGILHALKRFGIEVNKKKAPPPRRRRDVHLAWADRYAKGEKMKTIAEEYGVSPSTIYGDLFRRRVATMGIREVVSAPSNPWQNPYVERVIGSIRRECLDPVIVFNETHLRRTLGDYIAYYHQARTHLSLAKDAPTPRRAQAVTDGDVIAFPEVGGLHHRYERHAA